MFDSESNSQLQISFVVICILKGCSGADYFSVSHGDVDRVRFVTERTGYSSGGYPVFGVLGPEGPTVLTMEIHRHGFASVAITTGNIEKVQLSGCPRTVGVRGTGSVLKRSEENVGF